MSESIGDFLCYCLTSNSATNFSAVIMLYYFGRSANQSAVVITIDLDKRSSEGQLMDYKFDADEAAHLMTESRRQTHELFALVRAESDLRRAPADGFRPLLWH